MLVPVLQCWCWCQCCSVGAGVGAGAEGFNAPALAPAPSLPAAGRDQIHQIVEFESRSGDAVAVQTTADTQIEDACQQVNEIVVALESVHPAWTEKMLAAQ